MSKLVYLYKISLLLLLVTTVTACRKKIIHNVGMTTQFYEIDQGGLNPGLTWTQITSDEIADVYALEVFNNQLYVGGLFENAAGTIKELAKLDANDNLIHPGMSGFFGFYGVYDLMTFNNQLIIGGNYTYYSGTSYPKDLVRMSSSAAVSDIPFSTSIAMSVYNMTEYNSELIVVGDFQPGTNSITTSNVERISNWACAGMADLTGNIYGCAVYNNELYVSGPDDQLQKWNGSGWTAENYNNIWWSDTPVEVCNYGDTSLYMLGKFSNGVILKYKSNGTWKNVPGVTHLGTMSNYCGLKVIGNELYVYGSNFNVNGAMSSIIKFNGTSWSHVGNFTSQVNDIIKFNNKLYIAATNGVFKAN